MKHIKPLIINENLSHRELIKELKDANFIIVKYLGKNKNWGIEYNKNKEKYEEGGFNSSNEVHEFLLNNNINYHGKEGYILMQKYREKELKKTHFENTNYQPKSTKNIKNLTTSFNSFVNEKKFYAYYIIDKGMKPYSIYHDAMWIKFDTEKKRDEFVKKIKKEKEYKGIKIKQIEISSKKEKDKIYHDREVRYQRISSEMKQREKDEKNAYKIRKSEYKKNNTNTI
jgi:hypothetical protein